MGKWVNELFTMYYQWSGRGLKLPDHFRITVGFGRISIEHYNDQFRWHCFSILLRPDRGAEYCDQFVCLCVCPRAYLWNRWTDFHEIFAQIPVAVAWSSSGGVAIRYVYFRFCGRRHVWP